MIKIMKELKRHEIMRRIEQQDADQQCEPSLRDEAATQTAEKQVDLKKKSQFAPAEIGVMSFVKGDYDNKPARGVEENKPNQSQFLVHPSEKGGGKKPSREAPGGSRMRERLTFRSSRVVEDDKSAFQDLLEVPE